MVYKKVKNAYTENVRLEHNFGADWHMDYYHFHNVYEIYLAVTEGAEFWVGDQQYLLAPNDLLLLTTSDMHRSIIHDREHFERYILYFNPFYMSVMNTASTNLLTCFARRSASNLYRIRLCSSDADKLVDLFHELKFLQEQTDFAADVKVKLHVAHILIQLEAMTRDEHTGPEKSGISNATSPLITPIMTYIDTHYAEVITTDMITEHFYINRHRLNELFRDVTGLSFHQYVVQLRIIKAKELLEKGDISTTQACYACGFNDYSHFIRTFRTLVGMPPGKYAKQASVSKFLHGAK
ncbi:helix-turn-helix transcriptional regulator [Paenibacillus qinlingensis]|uniref:helix-turn-helix transcriptional regulator n=1 Tax=Paenibacillus qinlingensis TaxID=1837343 RepID=UPI001563A577|nr:AraC family transcriptional regulator [Paenibacillus qinlingensis]NQX62988.1 helix-turn-helix transcriptional regulator [Paenibacillus qinlingensis]